MSSKTLEDLMRRRDQIDAQIRDARVRQEKADRKARNHAMIVLGGMVEAAAGGDWRRIDFASLDRLIYESSEKMASASRPQPLETSEATKALREFETWKRSMGKQKKTGAAPAAAGAEPAAEPVEFGGGEEYERQDVLF